jgi:hypothetical protein
VFVASRALLGVPAEAVGQALTGCSRAKAETFGEAVVEAN